MTNSDAIFLRDESGEIFGAVCVNMDVTVPLKFDEWLRDMIDKGTADLDEKFEHSIDEVLEGLTRSAIRATGKNLPSELTREDKISVISHLDAKGAFLIRYSIDHVAKLLEISKYTIYSYLEEIKSKRANPESTGAALAENKLVPGS